MTLFFVVGLFAIFVAVLFYKFAEGETFMGYLLFALGCAILVQPVPLQTLLHLLAGYLGVGLSLALIRWRMYLRDVRFFLSMLPPATATEKEISEFRLNYKGPYPNFSMHARYTRGDYDSSNPFRPLYNSVFHSHYNSCLSTPEEAKNLAKTATDIANIYGVLSVAQYMGYWGLDLLDRVLSARVLTWPFRVLFPPIKE